MRIWPLYSAIGLTMICAVASVSVAGAAEPQQIAPIATSPQATTTVGATATPSPTRTPTSELPPPTPPRATPTPAGEPPPPTPPRATPTPALPEEGGPPGGVIAGHLYMDSDGSGDLSAADQPLGYSVMIDAIDDEGQILPAGYVVASDETGRWQVRSVPDGRYRVWWEPPVAPDQLGQAMPPAETIVINPRLTVVAATRIVTIKGASRVLDIDFGIPYQYPVAVPGVRLPTAGSGASRGFDVSWWLLATVLSLSLGIAGVGVHTRRR